MLEFIAKGREERAKDREENTRRFDILSTRIDSLYGERSPVRNYSPRKICKKQPKQQSSVKAVDDYSRYQYRLPAKTESKSAKKIIPVAGVKNVVQSNIPLLESDIVNPILMEESETIDNMKVS